MKRILFWTRPIVTAAAIAGCENPTGEVRDSEAPLGPPDIHMEGGVHFDGHGRFSVFRHDSRGVTCYVVTGYNGEAGGVFCISDDICAPSAPGASGH